MQGIDHQKTYLEHWLEAIGGDDISTVTQAGHLTLDF
jgi:hypothetical protein